MSPLASICDDNSKVKTWLPQWRRLKLLNVHVRSFIRINWAPHCSLSQIHLIIDHWTQPGFWFGPRYCEKDISSFEGAVVEEWIQEQSRLNDLLFRACWYWQHPKEYWIPPFILAYKQELKYTTHSDSDNTEEMRRLVTTWDDKYNRVS